MINNRKLLNGYFESLQIDDTVEALRIVDKIDKIGRENVKKELIEEIGVREATAEELLDFIGITGSITEILSQLKAKKIFKTKDLSKVLRN